MDPGSKESCDALLFFNPSRRNKSPAGQHKRGPFGSPIMGRRGERSDSCVGRYYVQCTYRRHNNNNNITYIVLCTLICTMVDRVSTSTVFGSATRQFFKRTKNSVEIYTNYNFYSPGPPATPLHLWHTLGGESSQQHSAYR